MSTINSISQTTNYKVFLPFLGDSIQYAQIVEFPDFTLTPIEVFNSSGKKASVGGDSLQYSDISVTFQIDENMELYKRLLQFVTTMVHRNDGILSDQLEFFCGIEITDNLGKPVIAFEFFGCNLMNVTGLTLDNTNDDNEQLVTITFQFDDWNLIDKLSISELKEKAIKA